MPKITYIDASGNERTVEGKNGMTVMETAIKHNIPGIDADCGGACACAGVRRAFGRRTRHEQEHDAARDQRGADTERDARRPLCAYGAFA